MKKLIVLIITLATIASCTQTPKDVVSISGQLTGLEATDTLIKVNSKTYNKIIELDDKGNFKDTMKINENGFYSVVIGNKVRFAPYLSLGNNLTINGDITDVENTVVFKGKGSETNNYLLTRRKEVKAFTEDFQSMVTLDSTEFNTKLSDFNINMSALLENKKIDTAVVSKEKEGLKGFLKSVEAQYQKQHAFDMVLGKGKASPKFTDLENYEDGTTSLDDFKGKYVYIDVWATWCRPCLVQIPALKKLEDDYKNKNIAFVSISSDKIEKHKAWRDMIEEKEMTGVHLFFGEDLSFMQEYQISNIPRFIFVDPDGNIVNSNAPRPTETEAITKMFAEAGL